MTDDSLIAVQPAASQHKTTCCYCGVGCGVNAQVSLGTVIGVSGDREHPANLGRLCVKGTALHQTSQSPDRLLHPIVNGVRTNWDTALEHTANGFRRIIDEHGPDAVAFYLSGQLLTEDYYVANKLMKGFIGTANVDTNSRLCMAAATVAHKKAFGYDTVPGCYEDLETTDLLVLVGSNTAYAHPVVFQRIVKAKAERPNMKVVVIDPRRTATCDIADLHLALRPGADAFLFNGLLTYLADHGGLDQAFVNSSCEGLDAALASARAQVPSVAQAATICDVPAADLEQFYQLFCATPKTVTVFSQGINQSSSGVDKGSSIINCHLASGKIGKPGATPFSITGQPNAMGGREVGGLANQLAAHMGFDNPAHIDKVARFWNAPNMAQQEGLKAVDMFEAIHRGEIKAVWIMATNPVVSMPDANFVREALERCELVVVNECIANTDTARLANVLLPATTWSEKHGTVTNSERCISLQKGLIPAPGEALNDWDILCRFARKLGFKQGFDYQHPVDIFREHAALSAFENNGERDFDISAFATISKADYNQLAPVQWPVNAAAPHGTKRMFSDGRFFTPSKRARLISVTARFPKKPPNNGQMIMNTGRIRDQWHTMSRTGNAPHLMSHMDEPGVDIHPADAKQHGLNEGELAVLENLGARYLGRVKLNDGQRRGEVFVPIHWNDRFASSSRADALVNAITDPICGQPEFKHSPVKVSAYKPVWQGYLHTTQDLAPASDYWCKILLATGFKYRLAHNAESDWAKWLRSAYPQVNDWVEIRDSARAFYTAAGFVNGALAVALHVARDGKDVAEHRWLDDQLGQPCDLNQRFAVLAGHGGSDVEDEGRIVCSCYQVGEKAIVKAIAEGANSSAALGEKLRCGTNCGSCLPELNQLVNIHQTANLATAVE
ncbi:nitrate reductase [Teredinibacter turnerae]|uniref:nitrate reductase n=1 Tax=Teredinibacter turnerae TaxID=2426 RepID=UPI00036B5E9A|nr:nitrate reductase [Teredinibacter turnerae]